jgi:DNA-binding LacI/PurR family transcriptional regulator
VPSQRKLAAARRVLEELGSPLSEDLVARGLYSLESGQAGATRLMAAGATAIVCASDPLALGAVRAARRQGRSVPADLSVVGFDDSALMSCTEPPLTTVRQPIESMGRTVIELLLAQIQTGAGAGDELLFEPELVLRASTAPLTA